MQVNFCSTDDDFETREVEMSVEEIQTIKLANVIEVEEKRYTLFELLYLADERKFVLWVRREL